MIFALDLATQTGWCAGSGDGHPELGTLNLPRDAEVGPFVSYYRKWLIMKLGEIQPSMVIFESPILPAKANYDTLMKLYGLAVETDVVSHDLGIDCTRVMPSSVKLAVGGSGRADKADMMAAARRCGLSPKTYDEADAFGVWMYGLRCYAKQHQEAWDRRLYSARGLGV